MKKNLILFAFQFVTTVSLFAQYTFKHIPIGGGGFVTGVISHKTTGDIYCRTDVGGAYRWDAANNKWVQLLDWLSGADAGFYGVEALAIDNKNPNNIYMLCGTSYISSGKTAILKSTDKGNTFTYVDVTSKFKAHGNGYGRGNGERLAVDPNNSNILFCGTRDNGLWKSTDGGVTWNLAWNGVTTTTNGNGICFVVFDPTTAVGGTTKTIYLGVSRTGSGTLYKSTDGGATFSDVSPTTALMPHRLALQGTTAYVTYADNEGPGTNGTGTVYKLNTSTGVWTNVTPYTFSQYYLSYGGVDIDPANVNRVVISTTGVYMNNQYGTTWGDFVYLTTDGGANWTLKNGNNSTFDKNGIGVASGQLNWAECAVFDPFNSNKVRVVGGGGIFTTSDITATNPTWFYDVIGIEETAFLDGVSIPGGPFICAMGDMTGFLFTDLTTYPTQFLRPGSGTNRSVAYASANANKVVRTSDADAHIYYSTNMGTSWTACPTSMGSGGRAALSADGGTILHCPYDLVYYSTDNGNTWTKSTGVTVSSGIPVADAVNSNYFYVYDSYAGKMYVSSNKGVSFSVAGNAGSSSNPWTANISRVAPGNEGHIWVPQIANGLKYSTDHGQTYTAVSNVSYCRSIGFGIAAPGASYPTIFIWGTVNGITGLYRSTDRAATWLRMNDDAHQFGGLETLVGDMNVFGRLYTGGGGVIYWEPAPCTPSAITPYVQIDGGAWQYATNATVISGGSIMFGPQPVVGGSWSWSGPNSFTATSREVTISNIQANQAGNYVATYTNDGGCQSTQTFTVTVTTPCTPTVITPYVQVNGGTWQQVATASVVSGGSVMFGPQPTTGGSWSWNGPNSFSATTREVTISNIQANQAGDYIATYTNNSGCESTQAFNITVKAATGTILREYWTGIGGTSTSNLTSNANYPNSPSGSEQLIRLEGPTNWADSYGARIRGYIYPTTSGSYTFWVAGDDNVDLYLSTNDNPANSSRIAYVSGWTNSREWNKYSTQQSSAINLTAGQRYYVEVLHKEGYGGDNVAVAWQGPGISQQVIDGRYLSPYASLKSASAKVVISTEEQANLNSVILYPNPSIEGKFTIAFPEIAENVTVSIYNMQGKLLYQKDIDGINQFEFDQHLNTGVYIIKINSDKLNSTNKLVVK